jgi:hypothetical protein
MKRQATMPEKFVHKHVKAETVPQAMVKKAMYSDGRPV